MSDIEFFAKINPKRLSTLDEDFKTWRKEIQEDDRLNALRGGLVSSIPNHLIPLMKDFQRSCR